MTAETPRDNAREPAAPETSAGWVKSPHNPVLGGELGTCFDVSLLEERGRFLMWFSWHPRKSVALVESADGIHWTEPVIVPGPNEASGWEDDINRPVVVKRPHSAMSSSCVEPTAVPGPPSRATP